MSSSIGLSLNFSGPEVVQQRETARALLHETPHDAHSERARLYAVIAAASVFTHAAEAREAATASAAAAANADGCEIARAWSLIAESVVSLTCESTEQRLVNTREALRIAQDTGVTEFVTTAYFLYLGALAELGQMTELDHVLSPVGPILLRFSWLNEGRHVAWFRCLQSTLAGQAREAENLANAAFAIAEACDDPDAMKVMVGQLGIIRWMQGRVVELEPAFLQARKEAPHEPVWAVCLAWMWLRQGRKIAARALVTSLPPVAELVVDRNWLATTCILAEVVHDLGEREIAAQIYNLLLPFEDRLVTIGLGVTCWGTVARPLALAAVASGRTERAFAHYRRAIEVAGRCGAHPWLAEAQWELAELLSRRALHGDDEQAVELASEAVATGRALQLHGIEGPASNVLASLQSALAKPRSDDAIDQGRPYVCVLGSFYVRAADGTDARWQSRKARQLLKILVARRGAAVSREALMDMLWPDLSPAKLANRFSVATTAVRRALDPTASHPRDAFVEHRDGLLRLRVEALDIDVERFLAEAQTALQPPHGEEARTAQLAAVLEMYKGEPLVPEQEELWAVELRKEVHLAFFSVAHTLADLFFAHNDHLSRLEVYRRILALDEFDQRAHEGVIDALIKLGSHGQAKVARSEYSDRMQTLAVPHIDSIEAW